MYFVEATNWTKHLLSKYNQQWYCSSLNISLILAKARAAIQDIIIGYKSLICSLWKLSVLIEFLRGERIIFLQHSLNQKNSFIDKSDEFNEQTVCLLHIQMLQQFYTESSLIIISVNVGNSVLLAIHLIEMGRASMISP